MSDYYYGKAARQVLERAKRQAANTFGKQHAFAMTFDPGPKRDAALEIAAREAQVAADARDRELATLLRDAREAAAKQTPENIQRHAATADPAKAARARDMRQLLQGVPVKELRAQAEEAATKADAAALFAIRLELSAREATPELGDVVAILNDAHAPQHAIANDDVIAVQGITHHAASAGPLYDGTGYGHDLAKQLSRWIEVGYYTRADGSRGCMLDSEIHAAMHRAGARDTPPDVEPEFTL
jgi:hypothetical protein